MTATVHLLRRIARRLSWTVLLVVAALSLLSVLVPPFLDRIYYSGPVSDHYDGARFFNPGIADDPGPPGGGSRSGFLMRRLLGTGDRPAWPANVPVAQAAPPARVNGGAMRVTWVGHATVLVQTAGLNILTDPVWSERAGPFGVGPARVAPPGIDFDRLPRIDLVLVSHNHYDHMDLATLRRLWARDRPVVVTSLGNDAVIASAGVPARALDWGGRVQVGAAEVAVVRNHHWGSRWFRDRNRALWSAFVVRLPGGNIFFAGDTGMGDGRWVDEARALGPVRLALIPIGAFRFAPGQMSTDSHIGPGDAALVFQGLDAGFGIPIHWGTFRLSDEARDTPPRLLRHVLDCAGIARDGRFPVLSVGGTVDVPPAVRPVLALPRATRALVNACLDQPTARALP